MRPCAVRNHLMPLRTKLSVHNRIVVAVLGPGDVGEYAVDEIAGRGEAGVVQIVDVI
ncbi:hypothetical protein GCM10009746_26430 [Microbacterium paludicola]